MSWKEYHDTSSASIGVQIQALKEYVNRVFEEHERAVALTQAQTAAQIVELQGVTTRLAHVDAVFEEHSRSVEKTFSGNNHAIEVALTQLEQRLQQRDAFVTQRFIDVKTSLEERFVGRKEAIDLSLAKVDAIQTAQQRAVELALSQIEQRIQAVQDQSVDRIDSVRREAKAALAAAELAISKSEAATARRFEAVNEFREQLSDQARLFIPREVADARIDDLRRTLDARLAEIRSRMAEMQTRLDRAAGSSVGTSRSVGYMITALGLTLSLIIIAATILTRAN